MSEFLFGSCCLYVAVRDFKFLILGLCIDLLIKECKKGKKWSLDSVLQEQLCYSR